MASTRYYSERICESIVKSTGSPCKNKQYYYSSENKQYTCGVHKGKEFTELPHRPAIEKEELVKAEINLQLIKVDEFRKQNVENSRLGSVCLIKMSMRKAVVSKEGWYNIFPNYRHQNRQDGFGCSSLSPMVLGPVKHGQPNLPDAQNLENFHQGNKVFPCELDEKNNPGSASLAGFPHGNPTYEFVKRRLEMYNDKQPHRHKFTRNDRPVYSVWTDKNGSTYSIDYITSRQFYCTFYERMVTKEQDFIQLKKWRESGYNLAIQGYDAYEMEPNVKSIEEVYLNTSRPFGHERVLFTMLVLEKEEDYPWRKHKTFEF